MPKSSTRRRSTPSPPRDTPRRHPSIIFTDLSDAAFPALETLTKIRAVAPDARVIGFASHVDLKSLKAAREAGYSMTLSRSEFTAQLPVLLKGSSR